MFLYNFGPFLSIWEIKLSDFYFLKGHYPCQNDYDCLPQLRICNNDPNWDNVYGTWVDFGGGSKIQSRGFRKIPLKTWTRVTFYRKDGHEKKI